MRVYPIVAAGGIALTAAVSNPALAAQRSEPPGGRYITQKMIDAEGGISFAVRDLGRFTVREVQYTDDPGVACRVSMRSLSDMIERGVSNGTMDLFGSKKVKVYLKYWSLNPGHQVCYGPGSDCVAKVDVDKLDESVVLGTQP